MGGPGWLEARVARWANARRGGIGEWSATTCRLPSSDFRSAEPPAGGGACGPRHIENYEGPGVMADRLRL